MSDEGSYLPSLRKAHDVVKGLGRLDLPQLARRGESMIGEVELARLESLAYDCQDRAYRRGEAIQAFLSVWAATDKAGLSADDLAGIMEPYVERLARLVEGEQ